MSWEERYLNDVLPEIEEYAEGQEVVELTSSEIASDLDSYTPQKVGKTLKYIANDQGLEAIAITGNNPNTWKVTVSEADSLEEMGEKLDGEEKNSAKTKEEVAEQVLDENPDSREEGLYSVFMDRLREYDRFEGAADSIERLRDVAEERKPEVSPGILGIGEQEYGKLRRNIDEVYEGLKEVKEERSGYFDSRDLKDKVDGVRGPEIGVVLSGLAAAGLVESYSDRDGYFPDSVDLESIQEFRRAVKHADSVESLQDFLDFSEEDE